MWQKNDRVNINWEAAQLKKKKEKAGCHTSKLLIFLAPGRGAGLYLTRKPILFLCFLCFLFVFHYSPEELCTARLLAARIWITLTHCSLLDWKRCLVFPKPSGLEMHAGWNPKPLITAKGTGWLDSHDRQWRSTEKTEEGSRNVRKEGRVGKGRR